MVKAWQLRGKSKQDLESELAKMKEELSQLRVAQATGSQGSKLSNIRVVRKSIARVLTVMAQSRKAALNDKFSGAKYKPTDLRFRKTRAKRRALTSNQRGQRTVREAKRAAHFPRTRVFALKA